jgi:hypothetical protein
MKRNAGRERPGHSPFGLILGIAAKGGGQNAGSGMIAGRGDQKSRSSPGSIPVNRKSKTGPRMHTDQTRIKALHRLRIQFLPPRNSHDSANSARRDSSPRITQMKRIWN